jgi:nucleoside-diphosphate-sugar epimerase
MPERWVSRLPSIDAVVHVAGTFQEDEEVTDQRLLDALLPHLRKMERPVRFIYTGGCWLYGATDGTVTTEESPFCPLSAFAWSVEHIARILSAPRVEPIVIHPAMVYTASGGAFERFYSEAIGRKAVRVVGSEHVRWPLVHSDDLAVLYRLALEDAMPGESYIGSAIDGLPVGFIARAFTARLKGSKAAPEVLSETDAVTEFGHWAAGYARDQLQSGGKARRQLGWTPAHTDPLKDIATLPLKRPLA